jgi:hypothetical protein
LIHDDLRDEDKFICGNPTPVLMKMKFSGAKTYWDLWEDASQKTIFRNIHTFSQSP